MDVGLVLSGNDGLTWQQWRHSIALAERLQFSTLYLTDHYFIRQQRESLEPFLAFVLAATESERIRFGSMVTPVTFCRPVEVGRMAAQLDVLSNHRFLLGLGAGWVEAEHTAYGLPYPATTERFDRLDEAIRLMRTLWQPGPSEFEGKFYRLRGADCQPKPGDNRLPIMIGGTGERRTLRVVAERADEWNAGNLTVEQFEAKVAVLRRHCEAVDRDPTEIAISLTTFGFVGPTPDVVDEVTRAFIAQFESEPPADLQQFRTNGLERGLISGSTDEVIDYLGRMAELGVQEVAFRHYLFDSDEVPEYVAADIAPAVADF
jgi:alkanesulfonate monooxygenase SsuD/methylene tetrahydromethanopterin reductase-like flavin-dependent oxidoreductase (luciferase family)